VRGDFNPRKRGVKSYIKFYIKFNWGRLKNDRNLIIINYFISIVMKVLSLIKIKDKIPLKQTKKVRQLFHYVAYKKLQN